MNFKVYISESLKYLLRSYPMIHRHIKHVESLYAMTCEELKEYENRRFMQIFNLAINKSVFYKELYSQHGITASDIKSVDDIGRLPVIDKSMIKSRPEDLLVCGRCYLKASHTSGTTGEPLIVYDDWNTICSEQAYHYNYYKRCGFELGKDRAVSLRGHLGRNDTSLKIHVSKTLLLSSYNIRQSMVEPYYQSIEWYRPKAIFGYPSSLYNLAILFKDNELSLNIPICFTSSETLYDYQRVVIEKVFGCKVFDLYGNTEHSALLYESDAHSGYFAAPGYAYIEVKEDSIITTPLVNTSFPLIRYHMNDAFVKDDDAVGYSWGQPIIASTIVGRTEQSIVCRDFTRIGRLNFLFKNTTCVEMAQIVQREVGKIDINIVPDVGFGEQDIMSIQQSVNERIGIGNIDFKINIIGREDIIYSSRNKFCQIVSYL